MGVIGCGWKRRRAQWEEGTHIERAKGALKREHRTSGISFPTLRFKLYMRCNGGTLRVPRSARVPEATWTMMAQADKDARRREGRDVDLSYV